MDAKLSHDFTNNCLRLEVLAKIICENIQKNETPQKIHLEDFEKFTQLQLEFIQKMKEESNL